jgi:predicted ATPase
MEAAGERLWEPELHRTKGRLLLMAGAGSGVAESCFRRAMTLAESQKALLFELRAATELSILLIQCGRRREALNILFPVYARLTEGFDNPDIKEAKKVLDHLG